MTLRIKGTDTVVVGHFNPWIIQPIWLAQHGILNSGDAEVALTPFSPGGGLEFRANGYRWKVGTERLSVHSDAKDNTASAVADVIRKLPHTPITATGINFRYSAATTDNEEVPLIPYEAVTRKQFDAFGEIAASSWGIEIAQPDGSMLKVTRRLDSTGNIIAFNFHRVTSSAKAAQAALRNFDRDHETSERFVTEIFKEVGTT